MHKKWVVVLCLLQRIFVQLSRIVQFWVVNDILVVDNVCCNPYNKQRQEHKAPNKLKGQEPEREIKMTTKEQERRALNLIKNIIEGLGENSYVATAFEGCFEIAEQNIDNDWACSMKQRAESAEAEAESWSITARDLKSQVERLTKAREEDKQKYEEAANATQERINKLRRRTFDMEHYREIWNLCYDQIENNKAWMSTYADTMADFSDHPSDIAFINAAKNFKKCRAAYEAQKKLLDYLDTINPEEK